MLGFCDLSTLGYIQQLELGDTFFLRDGKLGLSAAHICVFIIISIDDI